MRIPEKICFTGVKYHATKKMSLNSIAFQIDFDLQKLLNEYSEQWLMFRVGTGPCKTSQAGEIHISLLGKDKRSLELLRNEIEHILWKYNRQILFKQNGYLQPYFLRFSYRLSFTEQKIFILEGESK